MMFIFVASCYIGILFITDINLSFMLDVERVSFFVTLNVVKWIITSVFVPLLIHIVSNKNTYEKVNIKRIRRKRTSIKL